MRFRSMRSGWARSAVSLAGILVSLALRPVPAAATPAFGWRELAPPLRSGHSAIYDALRDRMIIYGGGSERMWSLALATGQWAGLEVQGSLPPSRSHQSAVYDPVRDRLILFGGDGKNDVWALDLHSATATWSQIVTSGSAPAANRSSQAVYDPTRDRLLVFVSTGGPALLYALPLSGSNLWSVLPRTGTPPSNRTGESIAYDGERDRLLVFGGNGQSTLWAVAAGDTGSWAVLSPGGSYPQAPDGRGGAVAVWDGMGRLLVYGGLTAAVDFGGYMGDVWSFDLNGAAGWTLLYEYGPGRTLAAGIYDPVRRRLVIHGGQDFDTYFDDAWAFTPDGSPVFSVLNSRGAIGPFSVMDESAICDPIRDRMVVFGGRFVAYGGSSTSNEGFSLSLPDGDHWTKLPVPPLDGCAGYGHTAIYDPIRSRMLVFGWLGGPCAPNTVLSLGLGGTPAWTDLAVSGPAPNARRYHSAVYDPIGDRMLVYGGQTADSVSSDLWSLALAGSPAWTRIDAAGSRPPASSAHSAVYDEARRRMLVIMGPDVWALSLEGTPAWTAYTPSGTGPGASRQAVYDPTTGLVLVVESGTVLSVLDPSGGMAWLPVTAAGVPPRARSYDAGAFDLIRGRMVLTGGKIDGLIGSYLFMHDLWAIQVVPSSLVGVTAWPPRSGLGPAGPNPARGEVRLALDLARAAPVRLAIFDPAGRKVRSIDVGTRPAGRTQLTWDANAQNGARAASGIYFVQVDAGGEVFTRRVVVLD